MTPPRRYRFTAAHRLHGRRAFAAVYDAKVRKAVGPLVIFAKPNDRPHPRLGLSVSRRVGNAVKRNRIKRLLREAFRIMQHDFPTRYDIVINVRPHETARLADYQRMLFTAVRSLHHRWQNSGSSNAPQADPPQADASRADASKADRTRQAQGESP